MNRIESVNQIEALDIPARIAQLTLLRDGWHDGEGLAPHQDGLRWLASAWKLQWPASAPLPRLFPTLAGGLAGPQLSKREHRLRRDY